MNFLLINISESRWAGCIFKIGLFILAFNAHQSFAQDNSKDSTGGGLIYPFLDDQTGGLFLDNPSNIKRNVYYNSKTRKYEFSSKIGDDINYRHPHDMDFDDYLKHSFQKQTENYWKEIGETDAIDKQKGFAPTLTVESKTFDRIFGGDKIEIKPQGSAELSFGLNSSNIQNPALPQRQQRVTTFDFDQKIQLNVIGNIGDKLKMTFNYNTEATFDFQNQIKLEYTGYEDEIIQKIEAGNVSLPLKTQLITGSQTLFGIKTKLKFGRLTVTGVFSQEKGQKKEITVSGDAQVQEYEKSIADYDANKHYFLSQFFRDHYNQALNQPPIIKSRFSVTKVEVWVSNLNRSTENTRNIVSMMDLGEGDPNHIYRPTIVHDNDPSSNIAANNANDQYASLTQGSMASAIRGFTNANIVLTNQNYVNGIDFETYANARLLSQDEYTLHPQLGYISMKSSLNSDAILAVAFEYTYNGKTYQVGEFSTDGITGSNALVVKLLKSSIINPKLPTWDLMMKNIYSLNAYNISPQDFLLDIMYLNPQTGVEVPFFPEGSFKGVPLIGVVGLDRVNTNLQPGPDGVFDFINGITIDERNGTVIFPVLQPFGKYLRSQFPPSEQQLANQYAFDSLYTTTQELAKQDALHDRYMMKGEYQSSSGSEISLNALNVPEGSVVVTSGGRTLTENVDYTVDYNLGRVKIINDGLLASGAPINISLESNSMFAIQTKTLLGARFDYKISDNFNVGGTVLNLTERPLTKKINMGNEPISNTVMGVDGTYTKEVPMITKIVDKLPFYSTKEKSTITASGEFAYLIPGNSRAITKEGIAYIDDFEGSQTSIDLRSQSRWFLASTPGKQSNMFPEGNLNDSLPYGYNRASLNWYTIDPLFWDNVNSTPKNIKNNSKAQSNNYSREVEQKEVFPNKSLSNNVITNIATFDLGFYPDQRGPYNYDALPNPYSSGVEPDGKLKDPDTRWGGIMRSLSTTDFESSNIEYIEFWVMDPFDSDNGTPNTQGGDLYFNLGSVSEDILKDNRKSFENGLPTTSKVEHVDTTAWGRVPNQQSLVNAFDNDPDTRKFQDVGFDGLSNKDERSFFSNFISQAASVITNNKALSNLKGDPSSDDYHHFRGSDYDSKSLGILERYRKYNGMEGNSKIPTGSYPKSSTTLPDVEDVNRDNNPDNKENYYQYHVKMTPQDVNPNNVGHNYITDVINATAHTPEGTKQVHWYQFKIPVKMPDKTVGAINGFKSIRFMRMFLKGFNKKVVLRFASLDLVRSEWRKYEGDLAANGEYIQNDADSTSFNISAVNVEENSERTPIPYKIPPGIERELAYVGGSQRTQELNEQSMVLKVCNLEDGDSRAAYKLAGVDIRQYKRLKMFAHVEKQNANDMLNKDDLSLIVRLGTDYDNNYYEYDVPLTPTDWGASSKEDIWPEYNNIDIDFQKLIDAKLERDGKLLDPSSGVSVVKPYTVADKQDDQNKTNTIRIKGNPNLAEVKVIMIGVKNPKAGPNSPGDDGLSKCAEVWVDELRLSDFKNKGGWATTGRVTAQIADLGTATLAANMSTPGWGSLEQKVNERQKETKQRYNLSTNIDLGKLLPNELSLSIPMYYGVTEEWERPEYNPLDPDVNFKDYLNSQKISPEEKDSVLHRTQKYSSRRSINFTNVHVKPGKSEKKHFYDLQNLSVSYAFTKTTDRDINTESNVHKTYNGGISYNYQAKPKNFEPFSNVKFFKQHDLFGLVKDFNFYLLPKQYSFQTSMNRSYAERKKRNNTGFDIEMPSYYQKTFYWNRQYGLKFDLTKSLRLNFNAVNNATIGEPAGRVDKRYDDEYKTFKDSVYKSINKFGINTQYHHDLSLDYKLPINKIPFLDWINSTARYTGNYNWKRAPIGNDSLGNVISNSNTKTITAQMNLVSLYNKVPFLKKMTQKGPSRNQRREQLRQKAMQMKMKKEDGDSSKTDTVKKKKPELKVLKSFLRLLTSVKNISINYSENRGTSLPGYGRESKILGFDPDFDAPGVPFVLGQQNDAQGFARSAAENGWLNNNSTLLNSYSSTLSKNLNIRATVRPLDGLRITLNATRKYAQNVTQQYFWDDTDPLRDPFYNFNTPLQMSGNFSMSFISIRTAFIKDDDKTFVSETFEELRKLRDGISKNLAGKNPNSHGNNGEFADGYGPTQQNVLIYAFKAAYSGKSANDVNTSIFPDIPLPNWRISYNGLSKLKPFSNFLKSINVLHSYSSTYSVASFVANLKYKENQDGPTSRNINNDFLGQYDINTVTITESFSPLVGFDMSWKNSLLTSFKINKNRNISLSLNNSRLTETKGNEIVIGGGYRFENVKFPIKIGANRQKPISDLKLRADVSIRNNKTVIRNIVENDNQLTSGQKAISIKFTADYAISRNLNIRAYYNKVITKPFVSTSFPTSNAKYGLSLRFSLSQ